MFDFLIGIADTLLAVVSFAGLIVWLERFSTTNRLKKYVKGYLEAVEFDWQNQTKEFAFMHRVRRFELLLRNVQVLRPTTYLASNRVAEVRDVLEEFHRGGIPILKGEHLPLRKFDEFPIEPSDATEAFVRDKVLEGLRAIKWLRLEEPAGK